MAVIKSNRVLGDGFKPDFYRCVQKYCSTPQELREARKKKGLIEIGYEDLPVYEDKSTLKLWSHENLKGAKVALGLSDNELDQLKNREIEDSKPSIIGHA